MVRLARMAVLASLLLAAMTAPADRVAAIPDESEPDFCEPHRLHDFSTPLKQMPALHQPSERGQIGFGPDNLRLLPSPTLVFGGGQVGVALAPYQGQGIGLSWIATTTLVEIDRKGRSLGKPRRSVERVGWLKPYWGRSFGFAVSNDPAFYRVTIAFRDTSGKRLGRFGFYYRVLPSTSQARLRLNASSYSRGTTVFGRVENFGSSSVGYGVAYSIERLEGENWVVAPESPRGPWNLIGFTSPPAGTGNRCSAFGIPGSMPPGRYRMVKNVDLPAWPPARRPVDLTLTAEFDVLP